MTPPPNEAAAEVEGLKPCPFCGNPWPVIRDNGIGDVYVLCDTDVEGDVCCGASTSSRNCETVAGAIRRWNCRPANAPVEGLDVDGLEGRFWLILHEPGMVPDLKGSWPHSYTAAVLRDFMAARPRAYITVLTLDCSGPAIQHGPERLQMLDGRSMGGGRQHNARTRTAHAPHHDAAARASRPTPEAEVEALRAARQLLADCMPCDSPSSRWLDHEEYLPMPRPRVGTIRKVRDFLERTKALALPRPIGGDAP